MQQAEALNRGRKVKISRQNKNKLKIILNLLLKVQNNSLTTYIKVINKQVLGK